MIKTLSPEAAYEMLASGEALLIDVREPDEFMQEHIAYALSIPLSVFETEFKQLHIPQDRKILLQCLKGKRGEQACLVANQIDGLNNETFNIEGGISAWKAHNLPTISTNTDNDAEGQSSNISIFRQVQMIIGGAIALMVILGFAGMPPAFAVAGLLGAALMVAGLTGWCGLAMLLHQMPWNKRIHNLD